MKERRGYKRKGHEDRNDLAGEHSVGDIGQIILLILFIAGWLVDKDILHFSVFFTQTVSIYLRVLLSLPVFLLAFFFARSGLKTVFVEKRKELAVIKTGVFSIVRHPIYLSVFYCTLGSSLFPYLE